MSEKQTGLVHYLEEIEKRMAEEMNDPFYREKKARQYAIPVSLEFIKAVERLMKNPPSTE